MSTSNVTSFYYFLLSLLQAMMNFVIKLSLCFCLLFIVGDCQLQKLVRAKRSVRVKSVYFMHMKSNVTTARIHDYVSELIQLQKNNSLPGFKIELHGIVKEVAHGFSAKLSKVALQKVSELCKLYYKI